MKAKVENFNHANTEPSRKYTCERCRDYRRGSVLLITGTSVRLPSGNEDIVQSGAKASAPKSDVIYGNFMGYGLCLDENIAIERSTFPACLAA